MRGLRLAGVLLASGCAASPAAPVGHPRSDPPPVTVAGPAPRLDGTPMQGALIRGQAVAGATLTLDGRPVPVAPDGSFVIGFDRDAPATMRLAETHRAPGYDSVTLASDTLLTVLPRAWAIERVDAPYRAGRTEAEFEAARPAELAAIAAARATVTGAQGWRQPLRWPASGRHSGRFGAQRVYQGRPGSYHSGDDIAAPVGAPVTAPADGVVILAADHPFTLEGNLLMIDHGQGLNSALLHLSRIDVRVGDRVRQGQVVGAVGRTGRVTGPHLHWSLRWQDAKLDPLLVVGAPPPR